MKMRNTLQALGALALLLVIAGFIAACKDESADQPIVIEKPSFDPITLTFTSGSTKKEPKIICKIPSSVGEESVKINFSFNENYLKITTDDLYALDYDLSKEIAPGKFYGINGSVDVDTRLFTINLTVEAKSVPPPGEANITVTINPGNVTATCRVNPSDT
jgi:hypothetical protein